jgi:hypothetical protein
MKAPPAAARVPARLRNSKQPGNKKQSQTIAEAKNQRVEGATATPRLIPLAKKGRTIVKGKCSECGRQFTLVENTVNAAVADQFVQHTQSTHGKNE